MDDPNLEQSSGKRALAESGLADNDQAAVAVSAEKGLNLFQQRLPTRPMQPVHQEHRPANACNRDQQPQMNQQSKQTRRRRRNAVKLERVLACPLERPDAARSTRHKERKIRQGHRLHIWKAGPSTTTEKAMALAPGELRAIGRRLFVGCGSGNDLIELLEVQSEGKKRMPAAAFLNGNTIEANETLT